MRSGTRTHEPKGIALEAIGVDRFPILTMVVLGFEPRLVNLIVHSISRVIRYDRECMRRGSNPRTTREQLLRLSELTAFLPMIFYFFLFFIIIFILLNVVKVTPDEGIEPSTTSLKGWRSTY